jgi:lysine N6-hydroxylase
MTNHGHIGDRSLTTNGPGRDPDLANGQYALIGVGVGPANLSLASLLHPHAEVTNLFLEKRDNFGWHDGQQVPGAGLQVSFLKDLVSLSQPTNPFSFLSYLHDQGKIYHFINAQFDAVPRQEFRNYFEWASRRNENIAFGEEVLAVDFDGVFVVHTSRRTLTANNIVVGVGNQPWVPPEARELNETHFHVSDFVHHAKELGGKRVAVVGGGQSGAEAFLDLISRSGRELPRRVTWVSRRGNYFPIDDSPFTNEYYTPSYSDYFSTLAPDLRSTLALRNILTSDGISMSTLREIYQRAYVHRFVEGDRDLLTFLPNREVTAQARHGAGWDLTLRNGDRPECVEHVEVDAVVWATGYRPTETSFLEPIAERLERADCEYRIDDDFAVCWDGPRDRNIFVQNAARSQRGLADPNLSLNAWRSQRIVDRLRGVRSNDQLTAFSEWSTKPTVDAWLRAV